MVSEKFSSERGGLRPEAETQYPLSSGKDVERNVFRLGFPREAEYNCGPTRAWPAKAKAQQRLEVRLRITAVTRAKNPKIAAYIDGSGTGVKVKLSNAAGVPAVL